MPVEVVDKEDKQDQDQEQEQLNDEWKPASSGDIYKFETPGASISGKFLSMEESKMYPDSFLVKVQKEDESIVGVFVSNIVTELLESNNILKLQPIKIVYKGKVKTQDGKFEYNDYDVFFK